MLVSGYNNIIALPNCTMLYYVFSGPLSLRVYVPEIKFNNNNNDMKINSDKSKEMLISFMQDPEFRNTVPRLTIDGNEIDNVQHAKLLGVTISNDLTWNKHVENIVGKARKRVYMLYQLKRAGIGQHDLVTIYVSVIRPVLEYACPVWHTNLNRHLHESIETVQKRALKCIYPGNEYADILCLTNLQ